MQIKFILIAVTLSLLASCLYSQNLIAVQNGGEAEFYTILDSAIVHAENGDTIYVPGGPSWIISQPINKRLHIIGVGHHLDSNLVTGRTILNGNISLVSSASNGSLCGIYLTGNIICNSNVTDITISRCNIGNCTLTSGSINWIFIENIIGGMLASTEPGASNCVCYNNIFNMGNFNQNPSFVSSVFKNNIFLQESACFPYSGCWFPLLANASIIENNIFISTQGSCSGISNSSINNNLFVQSDPIMGNFGNWGDNNVVNQTQASIFINQSGNSYNYTHDYHLQPTSQGKNAGTDGTDIGIYGGPFPWKDGSLPVNPHIQSKYIGAATDQNSNLNVNIKVAAQDH